MPHSAPTERLSTLRRAALAQIVSPSDRFRGRAIAIELGELGEDPAIAALPEFYEATVLTTVARGKPARRAQKPLYRLFRACLASGEPDRYERFRQVISYAVHDPAQLDGLYFHSTFATMDQTAIWADITTVIDRLKPVAGEVFLNSGTLLGPVRDQSLIAHDDDVDLALRLDAGSMETAAAAWQKTRAQLEKAGLLSERQPSNPGTMKLKSGGVYNIDLFPAWVSEGRGLRLPPHRR